MWDVLRKTLFCGRHIKTLHGGSGLAIPFEEYDNWKEKWNFHTQTDVTSNARFQRIPKFIEIIDQELTKKAVQMALSNLEKNPARY